jgi:hypothetical protein
VLTAPFLIEKQMKVATRWVNWFLPLEFPWKSSSSFFEKKAPIPLNVQNLTALEAEQNETVEKHFPADENRKCFRAADGGRRRGAFGSCGVFLPEWNFALISAISAISDALCRRLRNIFFIRTWVESNQDPCDGSDWGFIRFLLDFFTFASFVCGPCSSPLAVRLLFDFSFFFFLFYF